MTDFERQEREGAVSCEQRPRPHGELSDEKLVDACRAGDARAWEELVQRYQRLIYTVPMRLGLSEDEAGDVFQQACLRLFERLDTLRDPSRLAAWLVSTSRRLSLDALARRRSDRQVSEAPLLSEPADDAPRPEESLALLEEQQRIRRAVAQLPPRCRGLLFHLFYDREEPSYAQIATALGMPTGSIGPVRALLRQDEGSAGPRLAIWKQGVLFRATVPSVGRQPTTIDGCHCTNAPPKRLQPHFER